VLLHAIETASHQRGKKRKEGRKKRKFTDAFLPAIVHGANFFPSLAHVVVRADRGKRKGEKRGKKVPFIDFRRGKEEEGGGKGGKKKKESWVCRDTSPVRIAGSGNARTAAEGKEIKKGGGRGIGFISLYMLGPSGPFMEEGKREKKDPFR